MLHAGLDLSRRRLDVCLVDDAGELVAQLAAAPDADGLRHLARRVAATRVRAVIESMNGGGVDVGVVRPPARPAPESRLALARRRVDGAADRACLTGVVRVDLDEHRRRSRDRRRRYLSIRLEMLASAFS
jgi:hypothetical protein